MSNSLFRRIPAFAVAALLSAALLTGCGPSSPDSAPAGAASPPAERAETPLFEIEGRLQLADRADASGIQVFIPGRSILAVTGEKGTYLLSGLEPGSYEVVAQCAGYRTLKLGETTFSELTEARRIVFADATLEPDTGEAAAPAKRRGGVIEGKIALEGGPDAAAALPLARVEIEGTKMRTAAGPGGEFTLWGILPGAYVLVFTCPGYERRTAEAVIEGDAPAVVNVTLTPGGETAEADGARGIAGMVEMRLLDGSLTNDFDLVRVGLRELPSRRILLEPDGSFYAGALADRPYRVFAEAAGYALAEEALADLTRDASTTVTLVLQQTEPPEGEPGRVYGTAVKEGEEDHSGISVALTGSNAVAITDAAGKFELREVPPGTYTLIASAEGYAEARVENVELAAGSEVEIEGEIVLEPQREYPEVVETVPADGARDFTVRRAMQLTIRFNKKMRPESVRDAITIEPAVEFTVKAAPGGGGADYDLAVVEINGASDRLPVPFDHAFTLTVDDSAEDFEGLTLREAEKVRFRTGKAAVTGSEPADGAKGVFLAPAQPLLIHFNATLKPGTLDPRDIKIRPSLAGIPTVNSVNDAQTGWTTLTVMSGWQAGTKYEVTLPRRLKTASNQTVSNLPYTIKFETAKALELEGTHPRRTRRSRQ